MTHYLFISLFIVALIGCVSQPEVINEKPSHSILAGDSIYFPGYEKVKSAWADSLIMFRTLYGVKGHFIDGDGKRYDSTDIPENVIPVEKGPVPIDLKTPSFPAEAREKRMNGRIVIKIWIDNFGKPLFAKVVESSDTLFNESALIASISSRFEPAIWGNRGIGLWVVIPFSFDNNKR